MTIEALTAVASTLSLQQAGVAAATPVNSGAAPGVFDAMVQHVQGLNAQMAANQEAVQSMAVGQTDDLHRLVMQLETTKLEFELALQIRNKVLEAYQELMRTQV